MKLRVAVLCWLATLPLLAAESNSWPTLHGDLQRSGFYPHFPKPPLKLVWRKELWRELTGPRAEVIVSDGVAFMDTYAGNLYAWDAESGQERWVFKAGQPIGHSPAAADGLVFFGSMDRKVHAVEIATGRERWSHECDEGIWSSPVVVKGLVMVGDRGGAFLALRATDGTVAWTCKTGAPILSSASVSEDSSRVVFTSEDMHVYCLDVISGKLRWKSRQLAGVTARDYFPVIVRGLLFVTTSPVKDFHTILGQHQEMLVKRTGFAGKDSRYIPGTSADVRAEQDFIVDFLKQHPEEQTFYAFRLADGAEPWIAPILYTGGLHNPPPPPCVNRATGEVFTELRSAYGTWDGGGEVRPFTCFGKLDLQTGRVALLEHSYQSREPGRPPGAKDMPWGAFAYIGDETQTLSCSPEFLICNHQGSIGAFDWKARTVANLFGRRDSYGGFYGAANFGWERSGGYEKAAQSGQPYGLVNEWHGPARAIVSVVGHRVYFLVGSQVICLEGK